MSRHLLGAKFSTRVFAEKTLEMMKENLISDI